MKQRKKKLIFIYGSILLELLATLNAIAFNLPQSLESVETVKDTVGLQNKQTDTVNAKVVIQSGSNQLEISPASNFNNSLLIEPINRIQSEGIATSFYLKDAHDWAFYTNGQKRFSIGGFGSIFTSRPLLINSNQNDNFSALRVNGITRIDSALLIKAESDDLSFISFERNIKSVYDGEDDGLSAYTSIPIGWSKDFENHVPVFRMRHPNNVSSGIGNTSILRDFMILPYQYGFAMEFNGVVETWVGEWSIHRNDFYKDTEGNGNGYGAVMWVGNDQDAGGIRITARDNTHTGGNVVYGEISVERFGSGASANGDFRLRLPTTQNNFQFVYGGRGSNNVISKIKNDGLVIPKTSSIVNVGAAEAGQIVFDSNEKSFKGYSGTEWSKLSSSPSKEGSYTTSSNGFSPVYAIPHTLQVTPAYYNVLAASPAASGISHVTADNNFLYVYYKILPVQGTNNLSWMWKASK